MHENREKMWEYMALAHKKTDGDKNVPAKEFLELHKA